MMCSAAEAILRTFPGPLLARNGHAEVSWQCPLLGETRSDQRRVKTTRLTPSGRAHVNAIVAGTDELLFFTKCYLPHGCDPIVGLYRRAWTDRLSIGELSLNASCDAWR